MGGVQGGGGGSKAMLLEEGSNGAERKPIEGLQP